MRIKFEDIEVGKEYYIVSDSDYFCVTKILVYDKEEKNRKLGYNILVTYKYNGKIIGKNAPNWAIFWYNLDVEYFYAFNTKKEAIEFAKKVRRIIVDRYKDKIKTLKDLLELPFRSILNDSDQYYTDCFAIEAYKERCKELLGVKISTDNLKSLSEDELIDIDEFDD